MMHWSNHVAVVICQCAILRLGENASWKNIAWLRNGSSLKSFYYLWTTRYIRTVSLLLIVPLTPPAICVHT